MLRMNNCEIPILDLFRNLSMTRIFSVLVAFNLSFLISLKAFGTRSSPRILKIYGGKSFYITDKSSKPIKVKVGDRIPLDGTFELPSTVSVKIKLSKGLYLIASEESHILISKLKGLPSVQVLYGHLRFFLKSSKRKKVSKKTSKLLKDEGVYIQAGEFVALLKRGASSQQSDVRKINVGAIENGDFVFQRTPQRTALYTLNGRAFIADSRSHALKDKFYLELNKLEYIYGRLDLTLKFKEKHSFEITALSTLYKNHPTLKGKRLKKKGKKSKKRRELEKRKNKKRRSKK